jgi:preprotein translocase subunit YajC
MSLVAVTTSPLLLAQGEGGGLQGFLPIILMLAVVYFIVLRPMSKQEKERRKRIETIKKGDQVVIGGGILGRVSNMDDPKIAVVEIADKVKIRVLKKDLVDTQASALEDKSKGGDKGADKANDKGASAKADGKEARKGA